MAEPPGARRSIAPVDPPLNMEVFRERVKNIAPAPAELEVFDRLVAAAWAMHQAGMAVTVDGIAQRAKVSPEMAQNVSATAMFQQALVDRGIPYGRDLVELSGEQLFAIQVMTDPTLKTPVFTRLKRLGITYVKWQGWMRQPAFHAAYVRMKETLLSDSEGAALQALAETAASGDVPAIKLLLEITGRYVPSAVKASSNEQQYLKVIRYLTEAVQEHVEDAEALRQIGETLQRVSRGEGVEEAAMKASAIEVAMIEDEQDPPAA